MYKIREHLMLFGIRPSTQRIAVMNFLLNNRTHPTVDQIYSALSPDMPTLSKTTVYNTLKILEKRGAIISIDIDRTSERFDADTSIHGHALCRECNSIYDVRLNDTRFTMQNAPEGMIVENVQLLFKGICAECVSKAKQAG